MSIHGKHHNLFLKFLLYYSISIMLPLAILAVIILNQNFHTLISTHRSELKAYSDKTSSMVQRVQNFSHSLSLQPLTYDFLANEANQSVYDQFQVGTYINKICETDGLITSIYLLSDNHKKTAAKNAGIINMDQLNDPFLKSIDLKSSIQKWYPRRYEDNRYASDISRPVITFVSRAPIDDFKQPGYIVINLDLEKFIHELPPAGSSRPVIITDPEGNNILEEYNPGPMIPEKKLPPTLFSYILARGGVFHLEEQVAVNQWLVKLCLTQKDITEQLRPALTVICLIILISLILGVILSFFMAQRSIKQENRIDYLLGENSHILEEIEKSKPIMKEKLLFRILYNTFDTKEHLFSEMAYLDIDFDQPNYLPLVIRLIPIKDNNDYELNDKISHLCWDLLTRELSVYFTVSPAVLIGENRYVLILNLTNENFDKELTSRLHDICKDVSNIMNEKADTVTLFSFGNIVNDLHDLYESFLLARDKIKFKQTLGENVFFIVESDQKKIYPIAEAKSIIHALEKNDPLELEENLAKFFLTSMPAGDINIMQNIISYLLYTVAGHFIEDGHNVSLDEIDVGNWFLEFTSMEIIRDKMTSFFTSLQKSLSEESLLNINAYTEKAQKYMRENYHLDISLDLIASTVSLHPNYLTRIFKEYTGKTVIEYLTEIRIKRSKELLLESNESINSISSRLGYNDTRSFIRYFKKHEGVTPGCYREMKTPHLI